MWHTAEIVKILKKITNGYGYEVYQDKKKCVLFKIIIFR